MIKNEIDQLLNKYWASETTLDEELLLKEYFAKGQIDEAHREFSHLFGYLANAKDIKTNINVASILGGELEQSKRNTIDDLLAEYWSGESSVGDEEDLKLYFRSGVVAQRHKQYKMYFNYLSREESKSGVNLDVAALIKKEGAAKKEAIVRPIGMRLRRVAAIGAVLLAAGIAFFSTDILKGDDVKYAGKVTVLENVGDQDEAMEITKEALALLSETFGKGQASVANEIQQIEKLNIFFN